MKIFVWKSNAFSLYMNGLIISYGEDVEEARLRARDTLYSTFSGDKFEPYCRSVEDPMYYLEDISKEPDFCGECAIAVYGSE